MNNKLLLKYFINLKKNNLIEFNKNKYLFKYLIIDGTNIILTNFTNNDNIDDILNKLLIIIKYIISINNLTINNLIITNNRYIHFNNFIFNELKNITSINIIKNKNCTFYLTGNHIKKISINNCNIKILDNNIKLINLPVLEELYLNNNNIFYISINSFAGLSNLKILYLNNNNINLNKNVFTTLVNLEELYLNNNDIDDINKNIFNGLTNLKLLYLNNNIIENIDDNAFIDLINLKELYLSDNIIYSINKNIFNNLIKLKRLYLYNNQIDNIDENIFNNLLILKELYLNSNNIIFNDELLLKLIENLPKLNKIKFDYINEEQLITINEILNTRLYYKTFNKSISHINNDICNKCIITKDCNDISRIRFINNCIPFYNLNTSKINILNYNLSAYIYYDINNTDTYYLDKNFYLNKIEYIKLVNYNKIDLLNKIHYTTFNDIPIYFLFSDYNIIFNIFMYQYNIYNNEQILKIEKNNNKIQQIEINNKNNPTIKLLHEQLNTIINNIKLLERNKKNKLDNTDKNEIFSLATQKKDLVTEIDKYNFDIIKLKEENVLIQNTIDVNTKIINNIFRLDSNNNFISISYRFNIFNISLLCEKYKDIMELIYNNDIEYSINTIKEIFNDFNLSNIFYLINKYKTSLQGKKINKEFYNNKIFNTDSNDKNIKDIIKQENTMMTIDDNISNDIYKILICEIVLIKKILMEINKRISDFSDLFFMAILSYRFKNVLLNSTWGFNKHYVYNLINDNSRLINITSYDEKKQYYERCIKFLNNDKPIIYENDKVTYKNCTYGNCMENVILQFLKVIFWDNEMEIYNDNIIKKIIKPEYISVILDFFANINNEKSTNYIYNWVAFITELPNETLFNYDFIDKNTNTEMNATFNNLIIALRLLMNIETTDEIPVDKKKNVNNNIKFIEYLIKSINEKYTIIVIIDNNNDVLKLNTYKLYNIELIHKSHARFVEINSPNILKNLKYIQNIDFDTLYNQPINKIIKVSNLNAYIYLNFANYQTIENQTIEDQTIEDQTIDNIYYYYYNYIITYIDLFEHVKLLNMITSYNTLKIHYNNIYNNLLKLIKLLPKDIFLKMNEYNLVINNNILSIILKYNLFDNYFNINFKSIINILVVIPDIDMINEFINNIFIKYVRDNITLILNNDWQYLIDQIILTPKVHRDILCDKLFNINQNELITYLSDDIIKACENNNFFTSIPIENHKELLNIIDERYTLDNNYWITFFKYNTNLTDIYLDIFIKNYTIWGKNDWLLFFKYNNFTINMSLIFFNSIIFENSIEIINDILLTIEIDIDYYFTPDFITTDNDLNNKTIISLHSIICLLLSCDKFNLPPKFWELCIDIDSILKKRILELPNIKNYYDKVIICLPVDHKYLLLTINKIFNIK